MKLNPRLRIGLVFAALAATLGAVRWADNLTDLQQASADGDGVVAPTARSARLPAAVTEPAADRSPALDLGKLQRQRAAEPATDLFGPRNFAPPPPKLKIAQPAGEGAAIAPLPPPQAPPLPFTYIGKLAEDQGTTVFLAHGDRNLVVKLGDVIDNTYRVEEVTDSVVAVTYLPLNQRQVLAIGVQ